MTKPIIISGFPGVGKTTFYDQIQAGYSNVYDSDSSLFPKDSFPQNYIRHISHLYSMSDADYILVSSHKEVRQALVEAKLPFILVYPAKTLKWHYMKRYIDRGSPRPFLELMSTCWDMFLDDCIAQTGCAHVVLGEGEFLSDAIPTINGIAPSNEKH